MPVNDPTIMLVIGYVWPEPASSAAGSHMMSLLHFGKQQGWRVVFATPAQKTEHMLDLAQESIETVEIKLNDSNFDEFVSKLSPDIVLFDRFMMEEQFGWRVEQACPNAMRILDTEDLQFLRAARQTAIKQHGNLKSVDLKTELAKREIAAILRSDLSLIISDFELKLLQQQFKIEADILHHLPFILESDKKDYPTKSYFQREHFVTIGNFRHAPNWDSVLYLQQHIWPMIRKELPEAELHIYGSYPPKKATQLNNPKTGFLVKGWAKDAFEVLANARVCLSPLRFGAGIKGKFIDAMQVGTPSVTTEIGAEGMTGNNSWPGLVENEAEAIAQAAIELYQNEALWRQKKEHIVPLLNDVYNAEKLKAGLFNKIETIRNNLTTHRDKNFMGAILLHHSMKSTQYMSKWIETKNQLLSVNKALSDS